MTTLNLFGVTYRFVFLCWIISIQLRRQEIKRWQNNRQTIDRCLFSYNKEPRTIRKRKQKQRPVKMNINCQARQHCFKTIKITINPCTRIKQQLTFPIAIWELEIKGYTSRGNLNSWQNESKGDVRYQEKTRMHGKTKVREMRGIPGWANKSRKQCLLRNDIEKV